MKPSLVIASHFKNYSIHFVKNENELLQTFSILKDIIVVIDRKVAQFYPALTAKLSSFGTIYPVDVCEENKTLSAVEDMLKFFQSMNVHHSTTIAAIGGGILQDMVSFAVHIFYRGLQVILVPTTLLAMCDSCIGGKCGVNFNGYKNQLGAFHPPEQVLIWPGFLASLSDIDIRSGYGEIFKYQLLNSKKHYEKFKEVLTTESFSNPYLVEYIYEGLNTKKKWIEQDEFDTGVRRLLNFGHTFGHAIERAVKYAIPHGIAVAKGIDLANYIAWQRGLLSEEIFMDVHAQIEEHFFCDFGAHPISAEMLLLNVRKDKKIRNDRLSLILMEDFGKFRIESVTIDEALLTIVEKYVLAQFSKNTIKIK